MRYAIAIGSRIEKRQNGEQNLAIIQYYTYMLYIYRICIGMIYHKYIVPYLNHWPDDHTIDIRWGISHSNFRPDFDSCIIEL